MEKREYIDIEKELIPYRFETDLGDEVFEMEIYYNERDDSFAVHLFKEGEVLVYGEKLVYGIPLFADIQDVRFPAPSIIPLDPSNKANRVGWNELNETVFLVVDNDE